MSRSWSPRSRRRYAAPRPRSLWRKVLDYGLAIIILGLLILLAARLDRVETRQTQGAAMGALEHKGQTVSSRNPLRRLPVLELDDGTVITESVAICRYFEELHPEPALFGRGALGKAQVEMWQRRMEFNLLSCVAHEGMGNPANP